LLPVAGRFGYSFQCAGEPAVSVILPVRGNFATTMRTIASLRASTPSEIELIVLDRGSEDETRLIAQYVPGAKLLRFETDIGWVGAADAGRQLAEAPLVLFLASDVQLAPGSIDRARARMDDDSIGALGGLILQPHGVVAQAGGILWNDGGAHDYKRNASPLAPEVNFVRDTDFCTAAFLMTRRILLDRLGGFDQECRPGYETVDLCLRLAATGARVVYDPSVVVVQDEPVRMLDGCGEHFERKHTAALAARSAPGGGPVQVHARHAGPRPHRVLFIDDSIPLRRSGSGFVRGNDLVREIAAQGYAVTVFPVNGCDADPAQI
jgi:GT2 family glycosyltransferase